MSFTEEQREAVEKNGTVPMTIDGIECVVLRNDVYETWKSLVEYDDGEIAPEDAYPAILQAWEAAGHPQDALDYQE